MLTLDAINWITKSISTQSLPKMKTLPALFLSGAALANAVDTKTPHITHELVLTLLTANCP